MNSPKIADELKDLPHIPIDSIEPFQGNLKELSKREYNKLKKSLLDNGVIVPFFVWKEQNKILDGHQREHVFVNEGWLVDVPVIYISAENEQDAKQKLLVISSQYGKVTQDGWDEFTFDIDDDWIQETANFDALPFVFEDWGEPEEEGESQDSEPQMSRADELQQEWQVETGQMWRLPSRVEGQEHRIICGDCTDEAVVERVMGGDAPVVIFTDPPYGVSISKKNEALNSVQPSGRNLTPIDSDDLQAHELKDVLLPAFKIARNIMSDDCSVFVTSPQGGDLGMMMMMMMMDADLKVRHVLNWVKNAPTFSLNRLDYDYQHEPILFTWGKKHRKNKRSGFGSSCWQINKPMSSPEHPTMKPVELYEQAYENHSDRGEITYEMYCGSGTAIIASENTMRQCRAIEISPAYVSVALQRYKDAFGIEPELIG